VLGLEYKLLAFILRKEEHRLRVFENRVLRRIFGSHSFIHQWLYSPLLGPGLFFSFMIFFYTDGTTPWRSDQLVARPLPTYRTTQTQDKRTHALIGIRTHDPSVRASEDSSCLRPRGRCDRLFESQNNEIIGGWRKLHNEELHNLYSSPSIIRIIKSRSVEWAGNVACTRDKRVLVGKAEGKIPLGR
jgi:hypothetical protein